MKLNTGYRHFAFLQEYGMLPLFYFTAFGKILR